MILGTLQSPEACSSLPSEPILCLMTRTKVLALVALAAVGCGGGRSIMLNPPGDSTKIVTPPGPDASGDVRPNPSPPDTGPVQPDVVQGDTGPLPDLVPVRPETGPGPDTVEVRPSLPDAGSDVLPPPPDARLDLLPPPTDATPDLLPPPFDIKPDLLPPPPFDVKPDLLPPPLDLRTDLLPPPLDARPDLLPDLVPPDGRPPIPDGLPPLQVCANGEACSSDCKTTCRVVGTSACTCTNGVLACGACQPPNIQVTFTPCPDNVNGTACDSSGLACPVYTNGSITGVCACLDLGSGTRWNCI